MLSLEPTPSTEIVPQEQPVDHQSGFLPHYALRQPDDDAARKLDEPKTEQAVNEMGYRWFGFPSMRPFQHQILAQVLTGEHILGIAATGSGKSECFILPAMLLSGLTIVVSPLKSLMMDQYDQRISRRYGLQTLATFINGDVPFHERQARLRRMELGHYKLIYFTPEQLERAYVLDSLKRANQRVGVRYLAMDEAHCVSQWGHDFRSSYLNLVNRLREWGIRPVRIALTATASPKVREDLCEELDLNPAPLEQGGHLFIESSNRPELNLIVRVCDSTEQKVELIVSDLRALERENRHNKAPGAAIVFMPYTGGNPNYRDYASHKGTRRGRLSAGVTHFASYVERVLKSQVAIYHGKMEDGAAGKRGGAEKEVPAANGYSQKEPGDLSDRTRRAEQEAFISGEREIMVATKGFGMGIDKDNIRLVIHRSPTPNLEAYAQEAGRAGRDGEQANAILYYSPDSPSEDNGYGRQLRTPSDFDIQSNFLSDKYVRRSDVLVMRAFLRSVTRKVGDDPGYLYFTNDEAIDFFERCRFQPSLAGQKERYQWPEFFPRSFAGQESADHQAILDKGHKYQNKSQYIKRILDVLYRIRPDVDGLGNRLAFLERVQACGASIRGVQVLDGERIFASNAYFGQRLRAAGLSLLEFEDLLYQPDLLPLARRLKLSPSETEALLADIKRSEGYFDQRKRWIPSLLDYAIIVPPAYGPAEGRAGQLDAWRHYAGAHKRAYLSVAYERARRAGRPLKPKRGGGVYQSTTLNDWFGWSEVNRRMGWEVLPGPAFLADEQFSHYESTFMALHDERQRNDWAAYHRLLSDYVGVSIKGQRQTRKKNCLRSVLLGYLKTYDVIVGDNCYSCNRCVPDENFTRYSMDDRLAAVQRMSDATKELLDQAAEIAEKWPPTDLIEQILAAIRQEEAAGRSMRAYVEGWSGRLLQDTPGHLAALRIRSQAMLSGLFEPQPDELLENLRDMHTKADTNEQIEQVAHLISDAEALSPSPELSLLRVEVAQQLAQPENEAQAWRSLQELIDSGHASAEEWAYPVHAGLAELYADSGPLADPTRLSQHALLAARNSPTPQQAANWYRLLINDWKWDQIEAEIYETSAPNIPVLLHDWLNEQPTRQHAVATYLATELNEWAEWPISTIEPILQQLEVETLKTHPALATQGTQLTQDPELHARLQEAERVAHKPNINIIKQLLNKATQTAKAKLSDRIRPFTRHLRTPQNQAKLALGVILLIALVAALRRKMSK